MVSKRPVLLFELSLARGIHSKNVHKLKEQRNGGVDGKSMAGVGLELGGSQSADNEIRFHTR